MNMAVNALSQYSTIAQFLTATIPLPITAVPIAGYYAAADGGAQVVQRIATPSPAKLWHYQTADGAWWQLANQSGGVNVLALGVIGDGSNETAKIAAAIEYAQSLGCNTVVCTSAVKTIKVVELQITASITFDMGGSSFIGDFGAWGVSTIDATPIYWTKQMFYSAAANAPSVTFRNTGLNGMNNPANQMIGGVPLIDFRGRAVDTTDKVIVRFENCFMTRGSNRAYTAGSGNTTPVPLLDVRNMEILLYNIDVVEIDNMSLRSSPGEMLQIQSDPGRAKTIFRINKLWATKTRDGSPSTKWSSSALNVLNCDPTSEMRNSSFENFIKGPANWEMDGGLIESCSFIDVEDSNGLDFCEAGSYRFDGATVRNCYFENISNTAIRTAGSDTVFENNVIVDCDRGIRYENGVVGDPARGSWLKTTQVILSNNIARNNRVLSSNAAHANRIDIEIVGVSAALPIYVDIEGGSAVDRQPNLKKSIYGVKATNAGLRLGGYFGNGTQALIYLTGTVARVMGRLPVFAPETATGHIFELNAATIPAKGVILDGPIQLNAPAGGYFAFRNTGSTIDLDGLHIRNANTTQFPATTNNAVIARDGFINGTLSVGVVSFAAPSAQVVTVTGARIGDDCEAYINTSQSGFILDAYVSAANAVTVVYDPRVAIGDLIAHTLTAQVRKPTL